jgi:hypothetical protein
MPRSPIAELEIHDVTSCQDIYMPLKEPPKRPGTNTRKIKQNKRKQRAETPEP